jgi:hypothetical protein
VGLSTFAVSLRPDEPTRILWCQEHGDAEGQWRLVDLQPGTGYAGALCARRGDWQLACFDWEV